MNGRYSEQNLLIIAQTAYEWEAEQNDERRNIRILNKRYIDRLTNELATLLNPGA
jgi:hypothetical protein